LSLGVVNAAIVLILVLLKYIVLVAVPLRHLGQVPPVVPISASISGTVLTNETGHVTDFVFFNP
jgi:hypothetical protein